MRTIICTVAFMATVISEICCNKDSTEKRILVHENEDLYGTLQTLDTAMHTMNNTVTTLLSSVGSLNPSVAALQSQFAVMNSQFGTLNNQFATMSNHIAVLQQSIAALQQSMTIEQGKHCETGRIRLDDTCLRQGNCTDVVKPVTFKTKFLQVPVLTYGFVHLDIYKDTNTRVRVYHTALTTTGFSLDLSEWADTLIHSVEVNWMACSV